MKLSKEGTRGLQKAERIIEENINAGIAPILAMKMAGIKNMMDTYHFMEYLMATNNYKLWKLLKKKKI